jgi:hypothetical protein
VILLAAVLAAAAQEAPPPDPVPAAPVPAEPDPVVVPPDPAVPAGMVFDDAAPLLALGDVRFERVRRSTSTLLIVSGLELAAGAWMLVGAAASDARTADIGSSLVIGGFVHGTSALYQVDLGQRRHATFAADLAAVLDDADARDELARSLRLSAEREARSHAFASGVYGCLFGLGALGAIAATGNGDSADAALALSLVGGVGLVHHTSRWKASVRLSTDLDTLQAAQIPTLVP